VKRALILSLFLTSISTHATEFNIEVFVSHKKNLSDNISSSDGQGDGTNVDRVRLFGTNIFLADDILKVGGQSHPNGEHFYCAMGTRWADLNAGEEAGIYEYWQSALSYSMRLIPSIDLVLWAGSNESSGEDDNNDKSQHYSATALWQLMDKLSLLASYGVLSLDNGVEGESELGKNKKISKIAVRYMDEFGKYYLEHHLLDSDKSGEVTEKVTAFTMHLRPESKLGVYTAYRWGFHTPNDTSVDMRIVI
jgi:hypothetical protein